MKKKLPNVIARSHAVAESGGGRRSNPIHSAGRVGLLRSLCSLAMTVLLLLSSPVLASEPMRAISVRGEAERQAEPDEAVLRFTIETKGKELSAVKQEHDAKLERLYQLAGALQIAKKHLQTQQMRIHPEYRYHNGQQIFQGYRASLTVAVTLEDASRVGEVMQRLVEAKFDQIQGVNYRVKEAKQIREALLSEALKHARTKAETMASALNMRVGQPIAIAEGGSPMPRPQPMRMRGDMAESMTASAAPNPPAGERDIRSHVQVEFELIPMQVSE